MNGVVVAHAAASFSPNPGDVTARSESILEAM